MPRVRAIISKPRTSKVEKVLEAAGRALYQHAQKVASEAKRQHAPVVDGVLRASIGVTEPRVAGKKVSVTVFAGGKVAPYAVYVHEGTGPHWAPIAPLKDWAKKVLGDERLGYAVQYSISQRGTRAQPFLRDPYVQLLPKLGPRISAELKKVKLTL